MNTDPCYDDQHLSEENVKNVEEDHRRGAYQQRKHKHIYGYQHEYPMEIWEDCHQDGHDPQEDQNSM